MDENAGVRRRTFLAAGAVGVAAVGGGAVTGASEAAAAAPSRATRNRADLAARTDAPNASPAAHYPPNRAPLRPAAYLRLSPGAVAPKGWLRQQLDLELDGLTGRLPEVSDYLNYDDNGWVDPSKDAWEELTYWLRGLIDLGYVTGDRRAVDLAHTWVEAILGTQADDGFFGPSRLRTSLDGGPDFWPHMPLLSVLRSFHERTSDGRVLPFLTKYFEFQNAQPVEVFGRSWASYRWGDNIDVVYWLYNRTGDEWLLDLVRTIHRGAADYTGGIPNWHNVNLAQGFREPAQYGVLDGSASFKEATYRNYATVMERYGQFPGGGFAGDENARPGYGDPRQGFETCGIVEFMHSFELLTRMTGEAVWADRCEELAFNLLPAALDPSHHGIHYVTAANCVRLDRTQLTRGQFQNDFPLLAYIPGAHNTPVAYRCCTHNYGMGWPYFVEELWLATPDGGLCAAMYAASAVTARVGVGDGVEVTVVADTAYPFEETVRLSLETATSVEFPLHLRIPGWCSDARVDVNGEPVEVATEAGTYAVLERTWNSGDTVTLTLPMTTVVRTWTANQGAVSVDHGPLNYSLAIDETWETVQEEERWPGFTVVPASDWNYGLDLPVGAPASALELVRRDPPVDSNPFTHEGARSEITAPARRIEKWAADPEHVVRLLQPSPVASTEPKETVRLIPSGAARLRITAFPRIGTGDGAHEWSAALVTASYCAGGDSVDAVNDGIDPRSSADATVPRLTWWDHRGTAEWLEYDFAGEERTVSEVGVYWFDDRGTGECRVPASWRLLYRTRSGWGDVTGASAYGVERDIFNRLTFDAVATTALRMEVQLADGVSGGILSWRIGSPA